MIFLILALFHINAIAETSPQVSPSPSPTALEARWLGVAGVSLTDGQTTLLFDPIYTKPRLKQWALGSRFVSNSARVEAGLKLSHITKSDAVFVSHEHFDHAVDAAEITRQVGGILYGGDSLKRVADKNDFPVRFDFIYDRKPIQIGKFKVTPILRAHAPILQGMGWKFLEGPVPATFDFGFYDYHEGEVWCYRVEHPLASILIDQGSHFFEGNTELKGKVDAYFVGVANKRSLDDLVSQNIQKIAARKVIPIHFDAFFLQWDWLEDLRLPGSNLEAIRERVPELMIPVRAQAFLIP